MNNVTYVELTHPGQVAVTTAATPVLPANSYRSYALFTNISDTDIWLACDGQDAVVGLAVYLSAYGGSFEMSIGAGNVTNRSISAIHAGVGNKALVPLEGQ